MDCQNFAFRTCEQNQAVGRRDCSIVVFGIMEPEHFMDPRGGIAEHVAEGRGCTPNPWPNPPAAMALPYKGQGIA